MRFLIDESGFHVGGEPLQDLLERLVTRIQCCREHQIGKFSQIWYEEIDGKPLFDWLFQRDAGIDPVTAEATRIALDRSPNWDEILDTQNVPLDVTIRGVRQTAISIAVAATQISHGAGTACISPARERLGVTPVELVVDCNSSLHFVGDTRTLMLFFRDIPEIEGLGEDAYFENAARAFPALQFVREKTRFRDFDEAYATVRARVTHHLGVLNDHAKDIFHDGRDADWIQGALGSLGVDASGESPLTKANAAAMREREVVVEGRTIVCDWHTKIRRHIDRIYFNATAIHSIVIGIFRDHLT